MLFNSLDYLIFFPIVVVIYFLLPTIKLRVFALLAASYYFYMSWNPVYIVLILASTIIDYFIGGKIAKTENEGTRKKLLGVSLLSNLGILFYFKYYNFLAENIESLFELIGMTVNVPEHSWLLPVGISFYTFQTLSYTIDIYRRKQEAEPNFWNFALYVSFFPQLVAGPIERSTNLLPQFLVKHEFEYKRVTEGLKLILWGMFKKVVVADRVAVYVNEVFNHAHEHSGLVVWVAAFFFVVQVYCDFSGYTDMAIGSAKVMGFKLMDNFKGPWFSKNMTEFYRRWHISMSTWIRDYVYTPLGLATRYWGQYAYVFVMFVTFLLFGFWHGANWTFIFFGFLQGVVLTYEAWSRKRRRRFAKKVNKTVYNLFSMILTFAFWTYSCLIFRANNMTDIWTLTQNAFAWDANVFKPGLLDPRLGLNVMGHFDSLVELYVSFFVIIIVIIVHYIEYKGDVIEYIGKRPKVVRWTVYYLLIFSILFWKVFNQQDEFIYFQF